MSLILRTTLNCVRFLNAVRILKVSIQVRSIMDCLGGSAGIINGLAFFMGKFP